MTKIEIGQIYVCGNCEKEVIITKVGDGKLACCDKPMKLVDENNVEELGEENEEAEE